MMSQVTTGKEEEVVNRIRKKVRGWRAIQVFNTFLYWILGALGVTCSALAAATNVTGTWSPWFAAAAAVSGTIIGFANPQKHSTSYIHACRYMETYFMRYDLRRISVDELVDAADRGEKILDGTYPGATPTAPTGTASTGTASTGTASTGTVHNPVLSTDTEGDGAH